MNTTLTTLVRGVTCLFIPFLCPTGWTAQVDVLTANYNNSRSNANTNETVLNLANVNRAQFGKLFAMPVDGQIYAQPLYLHNVAVQGKGTRNVLFVATMHNSLYALDADAPGDPLWQVNFGPSVPNADYDFDDI